MTPNVPRPAKVKSSSNEYKIWAGMKQRCNNPKHPSYKHYGGRGITVCDRWNSFDNFLEDMGKRPTPDHQIDRIDNDGDYTPENCRWATRSEQGFSKTKARSDNKSGIMGVFYEERYSRWQAYITVNQRRYFLGYFVTKEEAVEARQTALAEVKEGRFNEYPTKPIKYGWIGPCFECGTRIDVKFYRGAGSCCPKHAPNMPNNKPIGE